MYGHGMVLFACSMLSICVHLLCMAFIYRKTYIPGYFDRSSCFTIAFVCAATLFARGTFWPRQIITTVLMSTWSIRLGNYLYDRAPYVDNLPPPESELWLGRSLWTTTISITCVSVNTLDEVRETFKTNTLIGVLVSIIGWVVEWRADVQKSRWHSNNPRRPHRKSQRPPCCTTGLWSKCRHPNYFGSLLLHWGLWLIVADVVPWWVIVSPLMVTSTIFIFEGGIWSLERQKAEDFFGNEMYESYAQNVPLIFPLRFKWRH